MILLESSIYSMGLWLSYILIGVALLLMFLGIAIAIAQNMKEGGMIAIVSLVVLVVLFGIGYAMSTDVVPANLIGQQGVEITPAGYKMSSGGLITFYIMAVIAFVLMIVGMVKDAFN